MATPQLKDPESNLRFSPQKFETYISGLFGQALLGVKKAELELLNLGPKAVPFLFKMSMDANNERNSQAGAAYLEKIGVKALPGLLSALSDPSASLNIVYLCTNILKQIQNFDSLPLSMRILKQLGDSLSKGKTSERFFAATLLGETNSSIAASLLLHALNDPDENVSKEAEKSLIKIGEKAIDAIIEVAIGSDPKLAKKAEAVLVMFGEAACKKLISRLESILFEEDSFYNSSEKTDLLKFQEKRLLEISAKIGEMRKFAFERLFQTSKKREYVQSILESDEKTFEPSQKKTAAKNREIKNI